MILSCSNISKSFGENNVLKNISFLLNEKDRAAIVGVNGSGKTTLFKMILGELEPTSGEIAMPKNIEVGCFSQDLALNSENTVYEEMRNVFSRIWEIEAEKKALETKMKNAAQSELGALMDKYDRLTEEFDRRKGFECESRIRGVIRGLGFSDEDSEKKISSLSGGQKTRCALSRLLLTNPELLLLDEPTNHLDIDSIRWLEGFLGSYDGAVIIVSHDRYFIDRTTTKIIEIENGLSKVYNGSYQDYITRKNKDREALLHRYESQQREIRKQKESIERLRSFNREKSIKRAESKEKALERAEKIQNPDPLPEKMRISLVPSKESGNDVLTLKGISKSFGENTLFADLDLEIKKGEKTALIGANGTGKTTLFKIITKELAPDMGDIRYGSGVSIGFFDQEQKNLSPEKTVFDEISDENPRMTETEIRNLLALFVFCGDDVFKSVSMLSGGEKGRLSLAKLMLSRANLLLLDEPTNHLDIYSKEILENALSVYKGTVLFISHDRYFINSVADKVIELKDGRLRTYLGNYDYYEEKRLENLSSAATKKDVAASKTDWQKQKEQQAAKRKAESDRKRLEENIQQTEAKIDELEELLNDPDVATDPTKAAGVYDEKVALEEKLLGLYELLG